MATPRTNLMKAFQATFGDGWYKMTATEKAWLWDRLMNVRGKHGAKVYVENPYRKG